MNLYQLWYCGTMFQIFDFYKYATFELRFSSCKHLPEVEASCQVFIHLLYFLTQSIDFRLLFPGLKRNSKVSVETAILADHDVIVPETSSRLVAL